jgi:cardiolipin synthase
MNWIPVLKIIYDLIIVVVCLRIIYDTRTTSRTLAYLMLTIFFPVVGAIVYFSFGINYRKRKLYSKKIFQNEELFNRIKNDIYSSSQKAWRESGPEIKQNKELAFLLLKDNLSPLSDNNRVKLLQNGEHKFPEVLKALRGAKHHIHIEYYIYEDDGIGNQIKDILIQKAQEGVKVRFIYDDFGSRSIRKKLVPQLTEAGVEAYPFHKVFFILLANRLNYRNHRKIMVIDGCIGFVGGINVSDRYINDSIYPNKLFWRDTHLYIEGSGVFYLQYLFLCDWNFCSPVKLHPVKQFFCYPENSLGDTIVQIAASGPDSDTPTILYSLLQAINLAQKEILITTPYLIPGESLLDSLIVAAMSGIQVKLLIPGKSDALFVDVASRSYFEDLMDAGVEIYLYKKGFIHAKTLVTDSNVSIIGTANMDFRSLELNFEVNALVYDSIIANELRNTFFEDLKDATKIDKSTWSKRPLYMQLIEKTARLVSPLL